VVPLDPMPASAGNELGEEHLIEFPDPTYSVWADANSEFRSTTLRFGYTSLTTPDSIYDYDLRTRTRTLQKRTPVVGGHEPTNYRSARVWANANDGERVPISLVWRAGPHEQERPATPRPLLLEGYGAYGLTTDPNFSSARLSLLDRGAIVALAHVRGGGELGRRWYDSGKLADKHNSFGDFIACAEHLISERWTTPAQLAATGGSAGGLLVGAVANLRPELFAALVLDVPFVDVLNTMLDPELPLSLVERDEWGDPSTADGFAWIRAYSPYENIRAQAYPDMLVVSAFNDTRVGYWEAAKWVARLRERKTDDHQIMLWFDMDVGHAGPSGRFEFLHEIALEYAYLLDRLGLPRARSLARHCARARLPGLPERERGAASSAAARHPIGRRRAGRRRAGSRGADRRGHRDRNRRSGPRSHGRTRDARDRHARERGLARGHCSGRHRALRLGPRVSLSRQRCARALERRHPRARRRGSLGSDAGAHVARGHAGRTLAR
jgi:oligopeptidase B